LERDLPQCPNRFHNDRYTAWHRHPHAYAGGNQRELTSSGSNGYIWGHSDQCGQPWLQSFNTGGGSQVFVERDASGTPLGLGGLPLAGLKAALRHRRRRRT